MRYGVVADIHGNIPAFEAVIDAMPAVDAWLCAGDVVGYNPWAAECVAQIRELDAATVMGNHDRAVASDTGFRFNSMASAGVEYARKELDNDAIDWLAALPDRRTVADGEVLIVHGHPEDPDRYTYPDDFSPAMLEDDACLTITGHTHVQGVREFDEGVVMNPGSVGQPRDGDPDAAFAVVEIDDETHDIEVETHRVAYDIDRVIDAVDEAGLPKEIGQRLTSGR
ncbi:metallophosphoesterase [Halonotius terrestris]|uniref:Metallophosphoesterase n=1 Tax=Halonotius terrestris TaxID=2487750 RepID=A0A8J8TE01_9EURY|nr:metallophosphoesterase family protein [Halonotius terrestris]TQQ83832.1 metallophosphoesterase [Halonotius terrestris]